mgnify:CR=1 FL=1
MSSGETDGAALPIDIEEGSRANEAFMLLADSTRLDILLALWERYEGTMGDNAMTFSELFDAVDYDDRGNFSYHLKKLVGTYLVKSSDGYELSGVGLQLVRTVVGGFGVAAPELDLPAPDHDCPNCGARTDAVVRDQWFYRLCTACDGYFRKPGAPDGIISGAEVPAGAFVGRDPADLPRVIEQPTRNNRLSNIERICHGCSGPVHAELTVCPDHTAGGPCAACGTAFPAQVRFTCAVCKHDSIAHPRAVASCHPAVVAFYYDRGLPIQYDVKDPESYGRWKEQSMTHEMAVLSAEPPLVEVTMRYGGDELRLTLDGDIDVVDVVGPVPTET